MQNMSNTVLAFAKLEFQPGDAVLEGLAKEAVAKIQTFSPQVRLPLACSLAKLRRWVVRVLRGWLAGCCAGQTGNPGVRSDYTHPAC